MAQLAQNTKQDRNTINNGLVNARRNRNWFFTLNNFMESEIISLQNDSYEYVFQEETGKNGTPHLQGLICMKNAVSLQHMKNINSRAHWEICKNKNAAKNYCIKDETRTGAIYSNMKNLTQPTQKKTTYKFDTKLFSEWLNWYLKKTYPNENQTHDEWIETITECAEAHAQTGLQIL